MQMQLHLATWACIRVSDANMTGVDAQKALTTEGCCWLGSMFGGVACPWETDGFRRRREGRLYVQGTPKSKQF